MTKLLHSKNRKIRFITNLVIIYLFVLVSNLSLLLILNREIDSIWKQLLLVFSLLLFRYSERLVYEKDPNGLVMRRTSFDAYIKNERSFQIYAVIPIFLYPYFLSLNSDIKGFNQFVLGNGPLIYLVYYGLIFTGFILMVIDKQDIKLSTLRKFELLFILIQLITLIF